MRKNRIYEKALEKPLRRELMKKLGCGDEQLKSWRGLLNPIERAIGNEDSRRMDINVPQSWATSLDLLNKALGCLKLGKELLPSGPQKQDVERALADAERSLQLAAAKEADNLNYHLCRCTFPPQIMLEKGANPKCEKCGREEDLSYNA